jgi:hypothetical protein
MVNGCGPNADDTNGNYFGGNTTQETKKTVFQGLNDTGDMIEETAIA